MRYRGSRIQPRVDPSCFWHVSIFFWGYFGYFRLLTSFFHLSVFLSTFSTTTNTEPNTRCPQPEPSTLHYSAHAATLDFLPFFFFIRQIGENKASNSHPPPLPFPCPFPLFLFLLVPLPHLPSSSPRLCVCVSVSPSRHSRIAKKKKTTTTTTFYFRVIFCQRCALIGATHRRNTSGG